MVLHYAQLCAAAGGVDAFLIGSELRGLTRVRASDTDYPAVAALKTLAADVRAILGPDTKIGYAADWSEYNNHQTGDAPGAVLFNLDPLWSDANIDFVGIDNYMPLADWRDGTAHARLRRRERPDLDPRCRLSHAQHPGRRGLRLVLRHRRPTATRRPARRSPMASASPGCGARRISGTGGRTRITTAPTAPKADRRPHGCRRRKPIWFMRARLSRHRQGRERAECLLRSEIVGKRAALLFQRRARRSDPAPVPARRISPSGTTARTIRSRPSMARRCWTRADLRVVLGCAAVSVLPGARRYLGRCGELSIRPLAERQAGRGAAFRSGRGTLRGCGFHRLRCFGS